MVQEENLACSAPEIGLDACSRNDDEGEPPSASGRGFKTVFLAKVPARHPPRLVSRDYSDNHVWWVPRSAPTQSKRKALPPTENDLGVVSVVGLLLPHSSLFENRGFRGK
jgi:hypothetical protein